MSGCWTGNFSDINGWMSQLHKTGNMNLLASEPYIYYTIFIPAKINAYSNSLFVFLSLKYHNSRNCITDTTKLLSSSDRIKKAAILALLGAWCTVKPVESISSHIRFGVIAVKEELVRHCYTFFYLSYEKCSYTIVFIISYMTATDTP